MAPLTWRNVDTPNFSGVASALQLSSNMMNNGFSGLNDILSKRMDRSRDTTSNAVMADALRYTDGDAYGEALRNGTILGGVDPSQLNSQAIGFLAGRRKDLLFDRGAELKNTGMGIGNDTAQHNLDRGRVDAGRADERYSSMPAAIDAVTRARTMMQSGDPAQIAQGRALLNDSTNTLARAGMSPQEVLAIADGNVNAATAGIGLNQNIVRDQEFNRNTANTDQARYYLDQAVKSYDSPERAIQGIQASKDISPDVKKMLVGELTQNGAALFGSPSASGLTAPSLTSQAPAYNPQTGYTDMITHYARKHGVNPEIAMKVVGSEGGHRGWVQSQARNKNGIQEPSYGPFQMLVGGKGTGFPEGLGNRFIKDTGLDPRDPKNAAAAIDYALKEVSKEGWGQWFGAAKVGVGKWDGVGKGGRSVPLDANDIPASGVQDNFDARFSGTPSNVTNPSLSETVGTGYVSPAFGYLAENTNQSPETQSNNFDQRFEGRQTQGENTPQASQNSVDQPESNSANARAVMEEAPTIRTGVPSDYDSLGIPDTAPAGTQARVAPSVQAPASGVNSGVNAAKETLETAPSQTPSPTDLATRARQMLTTTQLDNTLNQRQGVDQRIIDRPNRGELASETIRRLKFGESKDGKSASGSLGSVPETAIAKALQETMKQYQVPADVAGIFLEQNVESRDLSSWVPFMSGDEYSSGSERMGMRINMDGVKASAESYINSQAGSPEGRLSQAVGRIDQEQQQQAAIQTQTEIRSQIQSIQAELRSLKAAAKNNPEVAKQIPEYERQAGLKIAQLEEQLDQISTSNLDVVNARNYLR